MPGATSSLMLRLLGDSSDAEDAVSSVGSAAGNLVGKLAGVAAGALGIGAAFSAALETSDVQNKLAGKLGIPPAKAKELGETAGKIYANAWGDSMGEVSDAVAVVAQDLNGLANPKQFEGLTTKVLALADTFDVDVGQAVQGVGQLIRTGMVSDANAGFDLVTKAFQTLGQRGDDVLDTLKEYPVQFQALGLSGQMALGLISQGLKAGARDSDIVADALKEFQLRGASGSTATIQAFKSLGINAKATTAAIAGGGPKATAALTLVLDKLRAYKDPVQRAAIATALFGTKSEDMQKALLALDPKTAIKGLGDVAGAADKMVTAVGSSPQATLESFKRQVEVAVGQSLAKSVPAMQGALNKFAPMIPEIVGGVTSVLNAAVPVLVTVLTFLGPYIPTLTKIATVAVGVKLAMAGWGVIATGINAVRTSLSAANTALSLFRAGVAGAQATNLATAGQRIANMMGLAARNIGLATAAAWRWVAAQASSAAAGIRTAASVVATNAAMAAQAVWSGVVRIATLIWTGVQWLLNASFYGFPLVWIIAAIVAVVAIIVLIATKTTWFQDIWNFVWKAVVAYFNFVVGIFKGAIGTLVYFFGTWLPGVIRAMVATVISTIQGWWNWFMGITMRIGTAVRNVGNFFLVELPARIRSGIATIVSNITGFVNTIWNKFLDITRRVGQIGRSIVTGIWNGITGMGNWLWQQVTGFAQNIISTMMSAIGAHSPSRLAETEVGENVGWGVGIGLMNTTGTVSKAAQAVAAAALPDTSRIGARTATALSGAGAAAPGGGEQTYVLNFNLPGVGTLATALLKYDRTTGRLGLAGTV